MADYRGLTRISNEDIRALKELYKELNPPYVTSHRRRNGVNIYKNLSIYKDTRWFKWSQAQRDRFRAHYPEKYHSKALVAYFIEFPKEEGFLDRMETWVGKQQKSNIIAYALNKGQHIYLNDKRVEVGQGEGIVFSLSSVHEVKPSKAGALWANVMVLGANIDELV